MMTALRYWVIALLLAGMLTAYAADTAAPANRAMVMSTRGFARTSVLDRSAGKEAITAYRFEAPYGLAAGWRLPYLGFSEGAKDTIQLKGVLAVLDVPKQPSQRVTITFGGQKTATVVPNSVVESDPVDQPALPGAVIMVWTYYCNQDAKGPLPYMTWGYVDRCDGCLAGDIGTLSADKMGDDAVLNSKLAPLPLFAGTGSLIRSYQPMFIAGRPHASFTAPLLSVGFIGDSINIANGDFSRAADDDPYPARGWNGRACGTATPYVVFGQSGSNAGGFTGAQQTALFKYIFGTGAGDAKVTCLFDGYGINSMRQQSKTRGPGKVWRDRVEVAGIAHRLGLPYVQTTMTPMMADTLIADPAIGDRQTCFAAFTAERKAFNEQVRQQSKDIPGCAGFIDWGKAVETDPDAGTNLWQPGISGDGIHPNTEGYLRMSKVAAKTLSELKTALSASTAHRIRVACVGDSLTSGFRMELPAKDAYPAQLERQLGAGYTVQGFAEPGRTALRKAQIPLWKEKVFADAQAWQPDVVVICLGTNDSWPAIWHALKADFPGDLHDMVTLFQGLPSHPRTWLCLPPPLFIDGGDEQKKIMTDEINPAIRTVAKDTGSGLIDWYDALTGKANLFMDDKVHPQPTGAAAMAEEVRKEITAGSGK